MSTFYFYCNYRGDKYMVGMWLLIDQEMCPAGRLHKLIVRYHFGQFQHHTRYKQNLPLWNMCLLDTQNNIQDRFDCHEMFLRWSESKYRSGYIYIRKYIVYVMYVVSANNWSIRLTCRTSYAWRLIAWSTHIIVGSNWACDKSTVTCKPCLIRTIPSNSAFLASWLSFEGLKSPCRANITLFCTWFNLRGT